MRPCRHCGDYHCPDCDKQGELCERCVKPEAALARRGRRVARSIAITTMVVAVTVAGLAIARLGWWGVPSRVVRVALELWMCTALVRGSIPARFAYILLMSAGGVIALASAGWPVGVFYLVSVGLLFTPAARAYFRDPSLAK
jgi:hypothetical protein